MEEILNDFMNVLSSDDDEYVMNAVLIEIPRQPKIFRERLNHLERWNDIKFINRFRISKDSVAELLTHIEHIIAFPTNRNNRITPLHQLLITLRFYASGSMLIVVGDFGGIHKSTTSRIVFRVSNAIAALNREYIHMPRTREEIAEAQNEFYMIARFPKVIGAIDCTHIRIQSPGGENAENFSFSCFQRYNQRFIYVFRQGFRSR